MRKVLLSVAVSILAAGSASAADIAARPYTKAPLMAPAFNWSGFYVGGHIGWAGSRDRVEGTDNTFDNLGPQAFELKPSDWLGGGQIGFNYQTGNWVLGLEADIGHLATKRSDLFGGPGSPAIDDAFSVKYGTYYTITGRLGYAFDRYLVYAKGGYVNSEITVNAGDTDGGAVDIFDSVSIKKRRGGWTAGGGLEYGLTQNWSVKGEYLYMKFDDLNGVLNLDGGGEQYSFRDEAHTVKLGVNYRFNWGGPVVAKY